MPSATPVVSSKPTAHHLAALGYTALSLVYLRPIARVFATSLTPDPIDPVLNLYIIKWVAHQARLGFPDLWNAPFFFPASRALTYSDHLVGPGIFTALFTAIVPNAVAAYNVLLFSSFVLCGWTTWWVLRRAGIGALAAFFGGAVFAFSPFRWMQLDHVQVLLMQWIPLLLWSFDRLLARPTAGRAALFVAAYALHESCGLYLGFMVHFPLLALLVNRAPELWRTRSRRTTAVLLTTGGAALALLLLLGLPYLDTARERGLRRGEEELRAYGTSVVSFVTPAKLNLYAGPWPEEWRRRENALWAGFLPTALVAAGAIAGWKRRRLAPVDPLSRARRTALGALTAVAVCGFVLGEVATWTAALGRPDFVPPHSYLIAGGLLAAGLAALLLRRLWGGNWGLDLAAIDPWERGLLASGAICFLLSNLIVYLPAMAVVPGLASMRVPARFYAFLSLTVAWFAARALGGRRRALQVAAVALLLVELAPKPLPWGPIPSEGAFPAVYKQLAGRGDVAALLELPMRDQANELAYMYYGTLHWKPLVNGYSGYYSGMYVDLRRRCCHPVPDAESLALLRGWGVSHVLVHLGALREEDRPAVFEWGRQEGVRLDSATGPDLVFRIAP